MNIGRRKQRFNAHGSGPDTQAKHIKQLRLQSIGKACRGDQLPSGTLKSGGAWGSPSSGREAKGPNFGEEKKSRETKNLMIYLETREKYPRTTHQLLQKLIGQEVPGENLNDAFTVQARKSRLEVLARAESAIWLEKQRQWHTVSPANPPRKIWPKSNWSKKPRCNISSCDMWKCLRELIWLLI